MFFLVLWRLFKEILKNVNDTDLNSDLWSNPSQIDVKSQQMPIAIEDF